MARFTYSVQEIVSRCFVVGTNRLRVAGIGAGEVNKYEVQECFNRIFDVSSGRLRFDG